MITRITGKLVRSGEDMIRLEVGAFEYELYIPEFVRRQLQALLGSEVTLKTIQYIEGNAQGSRLTPRLIGPHLHLCSGCAGLVFGSSAEY